MTVIMEGGNEKFSVASKVMGVTREFKIDFDGIINFIQHQYEESESTAIKPGRKNLWIITIALSVMVRD
jgi:excinuclease ABC subunit A